MNFFVRLFELLELEMTTPASYGWFHIMFCGIIALVTVLLCRFLRDTSDRSFRITIGIIWGVMALLEVYKQLVFTFEAVDGTYLESDYQWYAFPYQFCSTPLYVLPLVFLSREGSLVRRTSVAFMCSYSLFAGIAVFIYPNDVFISTVGINIQTMIHHGMQIALGVFFAVRFRALTGLRSFLYGTALFAILSVIAIVMNEAVYAALIGAGIDETFNMFYISPHFDCTLPVLSSVYGVLPYPLFLVVYLIGFAVAGAVVYSLVPLAMRGIEAIVAAIKERKRA